MRTFAKLLTIQPSLVPIMIFFSPLQFDFRPDIAYITRDNVSLPALKNTMGTKAAERRKRTQILQKARLHKEVS